MSEGADHGGGAGAAAWSRGGSPGGDGFAPSALGTREHWDAVYERELQTFQEYGDTGEIWFGEESMARLIRISELDRGIDACNLLAQTLRILVKNRFVANMKHMAGSGRAQLSLTLLGSNAPRLDQLLSCPPPYKTGPGQGTWVL
ncbi:hypothetical protein CB1_001111018 [Camelus ferus]|nr:hypothetical protein CB1_001111018 [Camelus ferus]